MAPRQRRMVDPDYAGQVRAGISAKMNGQMTSSNSFKAFQTPMGGGISNAQKQSIQNQNIRNAAYAPNQRGVALTGSASGVKYTKIRDLASERQNDYADVRALMSNPQTNWGITGSGSGAKATNIQDVGEFLTGGAVNIRNGKLGVDPVNAALLFAPEFRGLGGLRRMVPSAIRYDSAAANIVRRSASRARRAAGAAEDAAWVERQNIDTANAARAQEFKPLRTETNVYRDRGYDAFDVHQGSELMHTNIGGHMTLADAEAAVRRGDATIEYTRLGTKVYRDAAAPRIRLEANAAANAAAAAKREAEALFRRSEQTVNQGIGGVKTELKRRVANVRAARSRAARLGQAGVNPGPDKPTAW